MQHALRALHWLARARRPQVPTAEPLDAPGLLKLSTPVAALRPIQAGLKSARGQPLNTEFPLQKSTHVNLTNQRVHSRYRFGRQVMVLLPKHNLLTLECYDISAGGCSILHNEKIASGTKCQLGFTSWHQFNPRVFAADAIVRYHLFAADGGFRLGIQFASMPESSRRILDQVLERLANPLLDEQQLNQAYA